MKYIKLIALVLMTIILTGCAASGPKFSEISSSLPTVENGKSRIYFYRESGFVGGGVQPNIKLNGTVVGESKPGGFFFVDEKPGQYSVSTTTEVENSTDFTLLLGQNKYVKTSVSMGLLVGHITPGLVDKEQAERDLQSLSYIGTPLQPNNSTASAVPRPAETSTPVVTSMDPGSQNIPASIQAAPKEVMAVNDSKEGDKGKQRIGRSSYVVLQMAKKKGCNTDGAAGLITERGPVEDYRIACEDGTVFLARCELRECSQIKQ